jgi:protein transport protein SEC24
MRTRFSGGYKESNQKQMGDISSYSENKSPFIYIQTGILYTHNDGTRRFRIHNYCIHGTRKLYEIFNSIDVEALSVVYMKHTIDKIFKTKKISNSVLSSESNFKAFIANVLSTQNLKKELPGNLIYLPYYILGLLKSRLCCKDELERKFDVDLSNYLRIKLQKMPVIEVMPFIYPRIYPIHNLLEEKELGNYDENGYVNVPQVSLYIYLDCGLLFK